jgi:hypothetical protein
MASVAAPLVLLACAASDAATNEVTAGATAATVESAAPVAVEPGRVEVRVAPADGMTATVELTAPDGTHESKPAGDEPVVFAGLAEGAYQLQVSSEGGGGDAGGGVVLGSALQITRAEPFVVHDGDHLLFICDQGGCAPA